MAKRGDAGRKAVQARLHEDFTVGVQCIRNEDYAGALVYFRTLDVQSGFDDEFQNRYTSFHGLARVLMGDASGVKLCRKAAVGNDDDAEVLYNLALAEHRLHNRESGYLALRRGLRVDPGHRGLLGLKQDFVLRRQHGLIPLLSREHCINRWIGRLVRGFRKPRVE
jgi:hypothetical protein